MDFWDLTKVLLRRWYVAFPLVALTVGASIAVLATSDPDYTATAYVQLIPPTQEQRDVPAGEEIRNPWLDLGLESLNSAATFITLDSTFLKQLEADGDSNSVTITEGYPNPVVTIEVVGNSKEQASRTADLVVKRFSETAVNLQNDRGVKTNSLISTLRLDTGSNIEVTTGKMKRALVAVGLTGLLLTASLTLAFDAIVRRRLRRRTNLDEPDELIGTRQRPTSPALPPMLPQQTRPALRDPFMASRSAAVGRGVALRSFDAEHSRRLAREGGVSIDYMSETSKLQEAADDTSRTEEMRTVTRGGLDDAAPSEPQPVASDVTVILPLSFGDRRRDANNGGPRT